MLSQAPLPAQAQCAREQARQGSLHVTLEDTQEPRAENFPAVIVHEAEPVAVVRRAQIVPRAVRNAVLLQQENDVVHPVFPPDQLAVANRPELTAPKNAVGMRLSEGKRGASSRRKYARSIRASSA